MRYDRRLLGAKQSKEQRELANKLANNRERELSSTEACRIFVCAGAGSDK